MIDTDDEVHLQDLLTDGITAKEIMAALRARHLQPLSPWVFFEEFYPGTGTNPGASCRIDAWAMNVWPSARFLRVAYEIKVSRGDFLREMRDPGKRQHALKWSNEYYFVTPWDLIGKHELPSEAGHIVVGRGSKGAVLPGLVIRTKVKAPYRETTAPTWAFLAAVARRSHRAEVAQVAL